MVKHHQGEEETVDVEGTSVYQTEKGGIIVITEQKEGAEFVNTEFQEELRKVRETQQLLEASMADWRYLISNNQDFFGGLSLVEKCANLDESKYNVDEDDMVKKVEMYTVYTREKKENEQNNKKQCV